MLANRVILITGASTGIGRTVAKTYASYGATVILLARSIPKLESLYDEIIHAGFPTPAIYPFNLTSATPADYQDLQQSIEKNFGRLDGLLLNAAQLGSLTPIEQYPIEQWYQVLQVNLNSAFLLTQATISLLKQSTNASIVFTLANEGIKGKAYWGAYGVSKFGLQGLMQMLAAELETHTTIQVNAINPGRVRTALRVNAYPGESSDILPLPQNMMLSYLQLMDPKSKRLHNQILKANGIALYQKA